MNPKNERSAGRTPINVTCERFEKDADTTKFKSILIKAADVVRKHFRSNNQIDFKSDGSPVTAADLASNQLLKTELAKLCPAAGWLSEETTDDGRRLQLDRVWIVDPIDGTKEFMRGVPECAISIGFVKNQKVIAGGVVNPITGEGGVVSPNGETNFWGFSRPHKENSELRQVTASVSRTEIEDGSIFPYMNWFDRTIPVGSVAYKLLRVAAGVDDLTFSVQPKSEWDICGGVALIQAVGKVYCRYDERPILFNQPNTRITSGAAAGPEPLVQELMDRLSNRSG